MMPAERFKAAWFDADRKVLSEKVVGTADTTISQIWTSETPLYGMGQQDLDTTINCIPFEFIISFQATSARFLTPNAPAGTP